MKLPQVKPIFLLLLLNITFVLLFWYRFPLRIFIPSQFHFGVEISIVILLSIMVYLAVKVASKLSIEWLKPFVVLGLITINIAILLLISSLNNRKNEVKRFFEKNEQKLTNLVSHYQKYGDDNKFSLLEKELNIRYTRSSTEGYHLEMHRFLGYGYRLLYSLEEKEIKPKSPGGSPTHKWFRINKHWYYYSYWD